MSEKVAPPFVKVNDTLEGSRVTRKAKLEQKPKGGPKAKGAGASIRPKEKKEKWKNKRKKKNKKKIGRKRSQK